MKCPRCGTENIEEAKFCTQCGLPREMPKQANKTETSITFNTVYAILLLCVGVLGLLTGLISLFVEEYALMGVCHTLFAFYELITAILLLCKVKVGHVLRLIRDITKIVFAVFGIFAIFILAVISVIFCAYLAAETEIAVAILAGLILAILLFMCFICYCVKIAWHIFLIVYYNKIKHLFK